MYAGLVLTFLMELFFPLASAFALPPGRSCSRCDASGIGPVYPVPELQHAAVDASSGWKLLRSPSRTDGQDFVSIMKTADTLRSDPDFAGLMVRCATKGNKIDILVVLVRPLPPKSRPQVTIGAGRNLWVFEGKMAVAGAAVILPDAAAGLAGNDWQTTVNLSIVVKNADEEINGFVAMEGLRPAYGSLINSCSP